MSDVDAVIRQQLAPQGHLRAAINLSNFLLVSGRGEPLGWRGVAPSLAQAIAQRLGTPLELVPYATPSEISASVAAGAWTIAFIGAEPARAKTIAFSPDYAQIQASYLVPPSSHLAHVQDVDLPGMRILAFKGSAYGLWLESNLRHAELVHAHSFDDAFDRFRAGEAEALAGLRPKLLQDVQAWPGTRILDGCFMTVRQCIGTASHHREAAEFLSRFVDEARTSGLVDRLIRHHDVSGLTATPAPISP